MPNKEMRFDSLDANERLEAVAEYVDRIFNEGRPMLMTTVCALEYIQAVCLGIEKEENKMTEKLTAPAPCIIISCDASIKVNPGGPSSVGIVIDLPPQVENKKECRRLELSQGSPATSNNQAEYDAVYFGLTTLMNLRNNPGCEIEVRSDSQLVIRQINGDMKCNDEKLKKRRDIIRELVAALPVPVKFVWKPRNSTPGLEMANYLAQDYLDVPRH